MADEPQKSPFTITKKRGRPMQLTLSARKRKKLAYNAARSKVRIFIGEEKTRWIELKTSLGLKTDAEMAKVLLDRFEETLSLQDPDNIPSQDISRPPSMSSASKEAEGFEETTLALQDPVTPTSMMPTSHRLPSHDIFIPPSMSSASKEAEGFEETITLHDPVTSTPMIPTSHRLSAVNIQSYDIFIPPSMSSASEEAEGYAMSGIENLKDSDELISGNNSESHSTCKEIDTLDEQQPDLTLDHSRFELSVDVEFNEEQAHRESDPDYILPDLISVNMRDPMVDNILDECAAGDEVFDISGDDEDSGEFDDDDKFGRLQTTYVSSDDDIHEKGFIAYQSCLEKLASTTIPSICSVKRCKGKRKIPAERFQNGSAVKLTWLCSEGHILYAWSSQPLSEEKRMPLGNIKLASALLFSGNNYTKIQLMMKFADIAFVTPSSYKRIQAHALIPAVVSFYEEKRDTILQKYKGKELVLAGDGRMDSPGYCAKYCTYTLMEYSSKEILDIVVIDKREADLKSPTMEVKGFTRLMSKLIQAGLNIVEVVTDAHLQITSTMKKQFPHIHHSYDIWHGAKNLGKKIAAAAGQKGKQDLLPWTSHVTNHFWYCAQHCNEDIETQKNKWLGILHHVVNNHSWAFGSCEHEEITEPHEPQWLEPGSDATVALRHIVYEKRLLNTIEAGYYSRFRSTYTSETFHNHLLMYAAKRFSYGFQAYKVRNYLAVLDHNQHIDRPLALTKDGNISYHRHYSKRSGNWSAVAKKKKKEYVHVKDLMVHTYKHLSTVRLTAKAPLFYDDPKLIAPTIAATAPPPTHEIVEKQHSRFSSVGQQ